LPRVGWTTSSMVGWAVLVRYFWEKDFLGGSLAVRAFWHVHVVEGLAVWAFDSCHFVEVFVYYFHPFLLQFFVAFEFRGFEYE
jgi:hypothetical protein